MKILKLFNSQFTYYFIWWKLSNWLQWKKTRNLRKLKNFSLFGIFFDENSKNCNEKSLISWKLKIFSINFPLFGKLFNKIWWKIKSLNEKAMIIWKLKNFSIHFLMKLNEKYQYFEKKTYFFRWNSKFWKNFLVEVL